MMAGVHGPDPKGYHGTFSFKYAGQSGNFHVTTHAYTAGKDDFHLQMASAADEKLDSTGKGPDKVVWPASEADLELYEHSPIWYSQPPEQGLDDSPREATRGQMRRDVDIHTGSREAVERRTDEWLSLVKEEEK